MNILESLTNLIGGADTANAATGAGAGAGYGGGAASAASDIGPGLGDLLRSGAMGPIANSLLTNKQGGFSWLKGALLAGAGAMLWNRLTDRMQEANAANPKYNPREPKAVAGANTPDQQAARFIRTLVYAAKADGHIDEQEKANINRQVDALNIGKDAKTMVQAAMNEPIDPNRIALGVSDPREALQLYTLSAAMTDHDNFMDKAYLDALAQALNIPNDVRDQVNQQVTQNRQGATVGGY